MAPANQPSDELKFVMTCIKYSEAELKPDFEKVAEEMGAKSANACYHRLWRIRKALGNTGTGGSKKTNGGEDAATPPAGQKRKSPTKKANGDESASEEPTRKKKPRNSKAQAAEAIKKEADAEDEDEEGAENDEGSAGTPEDNSAE